MKTEVADLKIELAELKTELRIWSAPPAERRQLRRSAFSETVRRVPRPGPDLGISLDAEFLHLFAAVRHA